MKNSYQEVCKWIYRNARPLELARWKYHFEKGSSEEVIKCLMQYQNEDGGFGHGLEPDAWNPNSAPIQTYHAIEIIREIEFDDKAHPMIRGMLDYLASGQYMRDGYWENVIASNNEYPHAPWWHSEAESSSNNHYNPSVGLAGFALYYADKDSELYKRASNIAKVAVDDLLHKEEINMHVLSCFIALFEYCESAAITDLVPMVEFKHKLIELVSCSITKDINSWATDYICKPSRFLKTPNSMFYPTNKDIADYESDFILNTRNAEGVWDITWSWPAYAEEWAISKNWWKSIVAIENLIYLSVFGRLLNHEMVL
jgi:hypothetical protein